MSFYDFTFTTSLIRWKYMYFKNISLVRSSRELTFVVGWGKSTHYFFDRLRMVNPVFIHENTGKFALQWHHNDHDGVSNHQPRGCLLNRLFRRRSKKTSRLRVTGLCVGNSTGPVNSPHKGPVTRKMFPFDDVIMDFTFHYLSQHFSNTFLCNSNSNNAGSYYSAVSL